MDQLEKTVIPVDRSDLIYIYRCLDTVLPKIEELDHTTDDEAETLAELDAVLQIVKEYLGIR